MSNPDTPSSPAQAAAQHRSPGQMLRAAREARGLHLAVLSMALKVPVRQLEALERDDYQAFKGITFLRAVSQSVCRQLGIDPTPVLAGLPQVGPSLQVMPTVRLDAPASPGRSSPFGVAAGHTVSKRVMLLGLLMLGAAAALVWWPRIDAPAPPMGAVVAEVQSVAAPLGEASDPKEASPASPLAEAPAAGPAALPSTAATAPVAQIAAPAATQPADPLVLRARADTWVEVRDKSGQMVLKRQVKAGETLQLDLLAPFFIYVGRADTTQLLWQGKPVDLLASAQNNETRLQIKP